jgi:hypothetical protein
LKLQEDSMFKWHSTSFYLTLIGVCLLAPFALLLWDRQVGFFAFVISIPIATHGLRLLRALHVERTLQSLEAPQAKRNQAQTILVQLVDENGNDLESEVAQAMLAAAQLHAGPCDIVLGVRRKVSATPIGS